MHQLRWIQLCRVFCGWYNAASVLSYAGKEKEESELASPRVSVSVGEQERIRNLYIMLKFLQRSVSFSCSLVNLHRCFSSMLCPFLYIVFVVVPTDSVFFLLLNKHIFHIHNCTTRTHRVNERAIAENVHHLNRLTFYFHTTSSSHRFQIIIGIYQKPSSVICSLVKRCDPIKMPSQRKYFFSASFSFFGCNININEKNSFYMCV